MMMESINQITSNHQDNVNRLGQSLGYGQAFDIDTRDIVIHEHRLTFFFASFLVDSNLIGSIIEGLFWFKQNPLLPDVEFKHQVINFLAAHNVSLEKNLSNCGSAVLNGLLVILVENSTEALVLDTRKYPGRNIGEPDSERVVRGSRDGMTETLAINLVLIRRRIKTGDLCTIIYQIGSISKTDVVLVYLKSRVNPKTVQLVQKRLEEVQVPELTMSDKALEELIIEHPYSPFPLVRYTERPDTVAAHLYQGMFALLVDTSPSAILGPVSIFDHMTHAEEHRQTPLSGTYLRILRYIGILLSFLLMPLWFSIIEYKAIFPSFFQPLLVYESNRLIVFIQIILAEVGIELLRMASIHTPNSLATSMGLIAGILIGEIAISVGLFTEVIVLLGAISAIGSYITPSYELSLANKIIKLLLLLFIFFFELPGLIGGLVLIFFYLMRLKSFGRPYLYPLVPFKGKDLAKYIVRAPYNRNKE